MYDMYPLMLLIVCCSLGARDANTQPREVQKVRSGGNGFGFDTIFGC